MRKHPDHSIDRGLEEGWGNLSHSQYEMSETMKPSPHAAFVLKFYWMSIELYLQTVLALQQEATKGASLLCFVFPEGRIKSNGKNFIAARHDLFTLWCLSLTSVSLRSLQRVADM